MWAVRVLSAAAVLRPRGRKTVFVCLFCFFLFVPCFSFGGSGVEPRALCS